MYLVAMLFKSIAQPVPVEDGPELSKPFYFLGTVGGHPEIAAVERSGFSTLGHTIKQSYPLIGKSILSSLASSAAVR